MVYYETLQVHLGAVLLITLDAEFFYACLAFWALFPLCLGAFVATNVNVFRWEHLNYLAQYILNECECGVVAGAKHIVRYSPHLPYLVRAACAAIFGVCGKGCLHVAGKVNLGDNGDVTLCSVCDNLAAILLCVEERAVVLSVILAAVATDNSLVTLCCNGGELGVFLYLDAPALVIGEVPMETVQVVQCKHVNETLD